ncbi:MAG: hypothetical protein LKG11_07420 [Bacilli bacterium]|jgi:hypothetical protein|nr:hypothetical protein [Bacilli bacterium]
MKRKLLAILLAMTDIVLLVGVASSCRYPEKEAVSFLIGQAKGDDGYHYLNGREETAHVMVGSLLSQGSVVGTTNLPQIVLTGSEGPLLSAKSTKREPLSTGAPCPIRSAPFPLMAGPMSSSVWTRGRPKAK